MKVAVGLSGGVDSAVAAYLLQKQGYEVIGIFMRNWDSMTNNDILGNDTFNDDICPQEQDFVDAKQVADSLGIPLHRVDFVKEYWDNVFTYFIEEHKLGRTPNPDIFCNKYIKFDYFIKYAEQFNVDYIATGHYAKVEHIDGVSYLYKGIDNNKDQTYFLSQLSQKQLQNVLFPLGGYQKSEIRDIAQELGLSVAKKKDSTGICFIGERDFANFLKNYLPSDNGPVVMIDTNEVIHEHIGAMYYTIGQRKGLGIGGLKAYHNQRMIVCGKNIKDNILYVTSEENDKWLKSNRVIVEQMNYINTQITYQDLKCTAKFRYRQQDIQVIITKINENHLEVRAVNEAFFAITPGQAAVFYLDDQCIAGGIIESAYLGDKKLDYL